jgi:hypothetical protein
MRRKLGVLLGLAVATVMLYGAMGTGASFTDRGYVYQDLRIGAMTLRLSSTTDGAVISEDGKTLTCPDIWVTHSGASAYGAACRFKVDIVGGIVPSLITVKATTTSSPGVESGKFWISSVNGTWTDAHLPLTDAVLISSTTWPVDDGLYVQWDGLTNASAGGTVSLVLTIDAVE